MRTGKWLGAALPVRFRIVARVLLGLRRCLRSDKGQMAVELMVCMPVVLALAIISCDLLVYLGDCAAFDRVSAEVVRLHAASPAAAEYSVSAQRGSISAGIKRAMGSADRLTFSVSAESSAAQGASGNGSVGSLVSWQRCYTCVMRYSPWPFTSGGFGASPLAIAHSRSYVIDPYHPGVVL